MNSHDLHAYCFSFSWTDLICLEHNPLVLKIFWHTGHSCWFIPLLEGAIKEFWSFKAPQVAPSFLEGFLGASWGLPGGFLAGLEASWGFLRVSKLKSRTSLIAPSNLYAYLHVFSKIVNQKKHLDTLCKNISSPFHEIC